ncbi:MAG TPA: DUF4433 domain-containing protein [Blastocatellia bacterium]|nr:DUF4433 domain-containing protein [Blastocatellia bacterium]
MTIQEIVAKRGVQEVLHFTTNLGLVGVLDSGSLKSRKRLEVDQRLSHIFSPNAAFRKDKNWLDYVNLSVSQVNSRFFDICKNRWHRHRNIWWCVLSFQPIILTHYGVYFTTTNNSYPGVQQTQGPEGLEAMYAERVEYWPGKYLNRNAKTSAAFTTNEQAEVLYPSEVSSDFLQRIYVSCEEDLDEVHGQLGALGHREMPTTVDPRMFGMS